VQTNPSKLHAPKPADWQDKGKVVLSPGKEKPIQGGHHWIFSGAIREIPREHEDGDILPVYNHQGQFIGMGYFNTQSDITGRMLTWSSWDVMDFLNAKISEAVQLRLELFKAEDTDCFRLINGEGDGLPGFIFDRYADVLVVQVSTLGGEKLKPQIVEMVVNALKERGINITCVYEKSKMPARRKEGLGDSEGAIWGELPERTVATERGIKYEIDFANSHKTGFYLDQREMRSWIGDLGAGRRVLNCCSYTGGFSLAAARGGATFVHSLDISAEVIAQAKRNFEINSDNPNVAKAETQYSALDVFAFLRAEDISDYNLVILDPPAFAKKQQDVPNAVRAYTEMNRLAIKKCAPNSFILTCSCSYHVNREMFEQTVMRAAAATGRSVRVIGSHRLATDHVINANHPENDYLKSLVLYVV
jgi:23S rRNA (cytosine1962-C5)-methyltransferase